MQNWVARNCTIAVRDGALHVDAAGGGRGVPFLTRNGLNVSGPLTLTVRVRAAKAGRLGLAWRTAEQPDFSPEQTAATDFPAGSDWRDVTLVVPASGKVIHVRLQFPGGLPLEVSRIDLRGPGETNAMVSDFATTARR